MQARTVLERALKGSGVVSLVATLQFVVAFVAQMALARILAPEVFGQFAFVLLVLGLVTSCRSIQAGEFLVYRKDDRKEAYFTVFTIDLILSVITTAVVAMAAGPIMAVAGRPELAPALRLAILSCLILPLGVTGAVFHREVDFVRTGICQVAGILTGPVLKVVLALHGFGIYSLIIGELARQGLEMSIMWFMAPLRPRFALDYRLLREAMAFSLPITLSSLLVYYYWKVDDFIVGRFLGMEQLGFYWLAFRIPEYLFTLRFHFVPIVFASFARLETTEHRHQAFALLTKLTMLVVFPAALVSMVFGDDLIGLVFGSRWLPAAPAFKLLMLTCALRVATSYSGDLFKVSGRTWIFPIISGVNAVLLTIGVYTFTLWLGITGTALGVLTMITLSLVFTEWILWRWFSLSLCRLMLGPVAALTAATVVGTLAYRCMPPGELAARLASTLSGGAAPWAHAPRMLRVLGDRLPGLDRLVRLCERRDRQQMNTEVPR
ncbi:MAG: oligosaccharide flippase family protein [Candidatus Riflebacteria bacterium]|nr:oligosaccharide flippase family protein [Candidatus Riflebacteria bacterium]